MAVTGTPTFEPTRAQWMGRRSSNPAAGDLREGDWWYRTDLNCYCYWDGANYHYWGGVGGIMFYGTATLICPSAGNYVLNISLSTPWAPTTINRIVAITNVNVDPVTDPGTPVGVVASPPIVGMTLIGVGHGTTLTESAVAMGW